MERNRSRFITEAVERELKRRQHESLLKSLENPHAEGPALADVGLGGWGASLPVEEASLPVEEDELVDATSGRSLRWFDGQGWIET